MPTVKLQDKTYDKTKPVALIWLPAVGTLYFALSAIWGLPYAEQVLGTIVALEVFLGAVLGISSKNYEKRSDGEFVVNHTDPMKDTYTLDLDVPFQELHDKKELKLHVREESQ